MFQHRDMDVSEVLRSTDDTVSGMAAPKRVLIIDPVSCVLLKVSTLDINWQLRPCALSMRPDHYQTCCEA